MTSSNDEDLRLAIGANGDASDERVELLRAAASGAALHGDVVRYLQPTGVMGTLKQMTLTEILQMMDFGKKTARVDVYFEGKQGTVHVHSGQIVRASTTTAEGTHYGEVAFISLCQSTEGFFRIHYEHEEVERNVQRPTTFVLLEALRVIDEQSAGAHTDAAGDIDRAFAEPSGLTTSAGPAPAPLSVLEDSTGTFPVGEAPLQQFPRYRCALPVDVDGVRLALDDIGRGGAFIRTEAALEPGAIVELRIHPAELHALPDDDPLAQATSADAPLELMAIVVHVLDATTATRVGRTAGMGVRFDAIARSAPEPVASVDPRGGVASRPEAPELVTLPDLAASAPIASTGGAPSRDQMLDYVAEVDFLIATGELQAAQRVLLQAHDIAPDDDDIRQRLHKVNEQIDASQAIAFLQQAERVGGKYESIEHARRAMQLWPSREVLLRALAIFARARAHDDVADVAEQLLELDPNDEGAMRTLLDANVAMQRWSVAVRAAEALIRRRPNDEQLKALLQQLVHQARRA